MTALIRYFISTQSTPILLHKIAHQLVWLFLAVLWNLTLFSELVDKIPSIWIFEFPLLYLLVWRKKEKELKNFMSHFGDKGWSPFILVWPLSFSRVSRKPAASKEIGLISSADGTIQSGSLYDQGKHSQKKLRGAVWHIGLHIVVVLQ